MSNPPGWDLSWHSFKRMSFFGKCIILIFTLLIVLSLHGCAPKPNHDPYYRVGCEYGCVGTMWESTNYALYNNDTISYFYVRCMDVCENTYWPFVERNNEGGDLGE